MMIGEPFYRLSNGERGAGATEAPTLDSDTKTASIFSARTVAWWYGRMELNCFAALYDFIQRTSQMSVLCP